MRAWLGLLALGLVAGCTRKPALVPHVVLGAAYEAGGIWRYPRESYALDETGIAAIETGQHGRLTSDGEMFDSDAMAVAHPTVQLPAIARLTDLDTGKSVLVRINDRGPQNPARAVAVTRRVASLLGFPPGGVARVRLRLEEEQSRAAVAALGGGPTPPIAISAAPREAVSSADLPPPGSGRTTGTARAVGQGSVAEPAATAAPLLRLPESVKDGAPSPGRLMIELGRFGGRAAATIQARRSGDAEVRLQEIRLGRQTVYRVVAGPFAAVPDADAALARLIQAGVSDARIVIDQEAS